jgi:uncharacterized protein YcgL (UPF0745 family)
MKKMNENENSENNLPKLNLEDEISFKKLKLNIESNALFNEKESGIEAEIENQFLNYVIEFEKQFENAKKITVFEKIGKPKFKTLDEIQNKKELAKALDDVLNIMSTQGIFLEVLCDYENENALIYSFIITELFNYEMDDITIAGMNSNFIYEEFHPNHRYDLENYTFDFIKMFLKKEDDFYEKFHEKDTDNHVEINAFRSLFEKFETISFQITSINFNEKEATTEFDIEFNAIQNQEKIKFSGSGSIIFKYEYGFWYPKIVHLPIKD